MDSILGMTVRLPRLPPVFVLLLALLCASVLGFGFASPPKAGAETQGEAIVADAHQYLGDAYCWDGGTLTPSPGPTHGDGNGEEWYGGSAASGCNNSGPEASVQGFDCSGLAMVAVYEATGIALPHSSQAQSTHGGTTISGGLGNAEPGDLLFFGSSPSGIEHVGIYTGGGDMINAYDYKNDGDNGPNNEYWGVTEMPVSWVTYALPLQKIVRYWSGSSSPPPPPPPVTVSNLLTDGGFQDGGVSWSSIEPPGGGTTNRAVYENVTLAREGTHYMEANTSPNGGSIFQDTSVNLPAQSSATASIWARVNPGQPVTGQSIALCEWDLNSLTNACDNLTLTHQWQQVQVTTTMPTATTDLRTQVYMFGEGNMDFDGAVLTQDLLTDGGFQDGGVGWSSIEPPGGGTTNRAVYENVALAREGTHYMEANTSPNGGSIFQDTSVNLPAEASATASIWARVYPGQPVTGQYIALCVWDLNSLTNACNNLTLTHQWQQVQVTTTMPSATIDLRTQVYMFGEGNMDFDGAVLTQDLLTDGGFQGGGYGWSSIEPPGGGTTNRAVYENESLAREGTHYLEANTSAPGGSIFQDTSVNLPAQSSATASIWARVNPGQPVTGQSIALCEWDLNSLTNACDNLTLTHQWQQVQVTTTMPTATTDLRTQVYMFGEGNMDFDGAVLGAPQTAEAVYRPAATSNPTITGGTMTVGSVLTCSDGGWADESNEPTSFSYGWMRDGSPIADAEESTYTTTGSDIGHQLTCTVTASNAAGETTATSSPIGPIAATAGSGSGGNGGSPSAPSSGGSTGAPSAPKTEPAGRIEAKGTKAARTAPSSKQRLTEALAACRKVKNGHMRSKCETTARRRYDHELQLARRQAIAACKHIKSPAKQKACVSNAERRYA